MFFPIRPAVLVLVLVLPVAHVAFAQQTVRIRVLEQQKPTSVTITATGAGVHVLAGLGDTPIAQLATGEQVIFTLAGNEVAISLPTGRVHGLSLRLVPDGDGTLEVDVAKGRALPKARLYPGALTIEPDPKTGAVLRLINEVDLDDYVAAVLPREYGFDDQEGAKAMAVVIRTYALRSRGKYGPDYDHTDHVGSQVYEGVARVPSFAREAVRQTRGEVLTYGGALIEATHFASSGGHTADNEDVWASAPLPYLRGKPDPYDDSPHEHWTSSIPRTRLLAVLSGTYGAGVNGFVPGERGSDGRVQTVQVNFAGGKQRRISSNVFRALISRHFGVKALKSTRFTVRRQGETYVFEGQGYGHGVGLNQWGTHAMAERGYGYRDILAFYYTGVAVASSREEQRSLTVRPAPTGPPARVTRTASDQGAPAASARSRW